MPSFHQIGDILERAKAAAVDYYQLTGKPLGITGEIGEYIAAKHLGLDLAEARTAGYDATDRQGRRIQVKARSIRSGKRLSGQVGSIRLEHDWDVVVLVLMDELFEAKVIHEADRPAIEAALTKPGSKARNERGSLAIVTAFYRFDEDHDDVVIAKIIHGRRDIPRLLDSLAVRCFAKRAFSSMAKRPALAPGSAIGNKSPISLMNRSPAQLPA